MTLEHIHVHVYSSKLKVDILLAHEFKSLGGFSYFSWIGDVQKKQEVFKKHILKDNTRLNAPLISDLVHVLVI